MTKDARADQVEHWHDLFNSGELYNYLDPELVAYQNACVQRLREYNASPDTPEGLARRAELLRRLLGTWSEGVTFLPPVHANWGLRHVHAGRDVFVNFDVKFVDDADIYLGANTMIGPGCTIATAIHPESPRLRRQMMQRNEPVRIGENVWIAADVTICPGVTIGDDSIIGAGSVVTRDVPAGVVAFGTPARVVRPVAEDDGA